MAQTPEQALAAVMEAADKYADEAGFSFVHVGERGFSWDLDARALLQEAIEAYADARVWEATKHRRIPKGGQPLADIVCGHLELGRIYSRQLEEEVKSGQLEQAAEYAKCAREHAERIEAAILTARTNEEG